MVSHYFDLQASWPTIHLSIFLVYLSFLRYLRWRHLRHLDEQPSLSPPDDDDIIHRAHAIHVDTIHRDQYFLSRKGVEFGLIKTFAIPSISKLLAGTGEFRRNTEGRSEDVDLLVMEFLEHPPKSNRERLAIRRMNAIHANYKGKISNEDYVYVLCVFACQAIMWIDRYSWREVHPLERQAVSMMAGTLHVSQICKGLQVIFHLLSYPQHVNSTQSYVYWRYIGNEMGIQNIPQSHEAMEEYLHTFEKSKMGYSKSNTDVLEPVLNFNLSRCPKVARPLFRQLLAAMSHDQMQGALGMAAPPRCAVFLLHFVLYVRGIFEEYLLPPRRKRLQRTPLDANKSDFERVRPSFHPATACPYRITGYRIGELGPPGLLKDDEFGNELFSE